MQSQTVRLKLFHFTLLLDSEQKPDVVWPCTDSIIVSVTSDCTSLLAFGTSSGTVVVWDVYRGEFGSFMSFFVILNSSLIAFVCISNIDFGLLFEQQLKCMFTKILTCL